MSKKFLRLFLKEINNSRILILLVFLISLTLASLFYYSKQSNKLSSSYVLLKPPHTLLLKYNHLNQIKAVNFGTFYNDFLFELLSISNFEEYIKNDVNYEIINKFFKTNKIDLQYFLKNNFFAQQGGMLVIVNKLTIPKIVFNYPDSYPGHEVLNKFVKTVFEKEIKKYLEKIYNHLKIEDQLFKAYKYNTDEINLINYNNIKKNEMRLKIVKLSLKDDRINNEIILQKAFNLKKNKFSIILKYFFISFISSILISIFLIFIRLIKI
jgi:hypothetical protein